MPRCHQRNPDVVGLESKYQFYFFLVLGSCLEYFIFLYFPLGESNRQPGLKPVICMYGLPVIYQALHLSSVKYTWRFTDWRKQHDGEHLEMERKSKIPSL